MKNEFCPITYPHNAKKFNGDEFDKRPAVHSFFPTFIINVSATINSSKFLLVKLL